MAYSMAYKNWLFDCGNRSEYVIYRAIEELNRQRLERGDKPVSLNEGAMLRHRIVEELSKDKGVTSFVTSSFDNNLRKELNSVQMNGLLMSIQPEGEFETKFGEKTFKNVSADDLKSQIISQENRSKDRRSAFVSAIQTVIPEVDMTEEKLDSLMSRYSDYRSSGKRLVPLSPYTPALFNRSFTYRNPGSLVLVASDDFSTNNEVDFSRIYKPTRDEIDNEAKLYTATHSTFGRDGGDVYKTKSVYVSRDENQAIFYTDSDDFHLNEFGKYLTTEDSANLTNHCMKYYRRTGTAYSESNMKKSALLLQRLAEEGYTYKVVTKPAGEVDLRIENLGGSYDVNIIPSPETSFAYHYGRVYSCNTGVSYNLTSNKREIDNEGKHHHVPYEATVTDVVNVLKYSMGEELVQKRAVLGPEGSDGVRNAFDMETSVGKVGMTIDAYSHKGYNDAYYTSGSTDASGANFAAKYGKKNGAVIYLRANAADSKPKTVFLGRKGSTKEEDAETYLKEWIESARQTYVEEMNIDELIKQAQLHKVTNELTDEQRDYEFPFSSIPAIADKQKTYWSAIVDDGTRNEHNLHRILGDEEFYEGPIEEQVRQHFADSLHTDIGTFEPDENGKRYSIYGIVDYAKVPMPQTRLRLSIISATNVLEFGPNDLQDDDLQGESVKNMLIRYNENTAKPIFHHGSKFIRDMGTTIKTTLETSGIIVDDNDITIDDNGIVQYKGKKVRGRDVNLTYSNDVKDGALKTNEIVGHIGQIFEPDGYGTVTTKFAGGDNYMFVPGYMASILPQKDGETKSYEERTRLLGYEQLMMQRIKAQIRADLFVPIDNYNGAALGATTSLNKVYTNLYDVRHPVDYFERTREEGMSDDYLRAVIDTEARRVRYDSSFKEGATLNAYFQANSHPETLIDDRNINPLTLTGFRNMAIMSEEGDGYFDPDATSTGMNQGITRYLVESAEVMPDGSIKRGDLDDKTPLCKHPVMKWADYVPFDRRQMVFNNAIKAQRITDKVKTAQMTFGGWNFDDGFVVTKKFAETYQVRDGKGNMRPIAIGDKILDKNGNKGVISLIVDPDMPMEEAKEKGIEDIMAVVKNNPDIDIYCAPFPAVSRFNGGTARELMENVSDVKMPDGTIRKGCAGEAEFIVTPMTADHKTSVYIDTDEEYDTSQFNIGRIKDGKGRRSSAQLAWALDSKDATAIKREFYKDNDKAFTTMREYFISTGFDISETGVVMRGYTPHNYTEVRNVFSMPEIENLNEPLTISAINKRCTELTATISHSGGFMELPFPLDFPNGDTIPMVQVDHEEVVGDKTVDVNYSKDSWVVNRDGKEIVYHRSKDLLENGGSKTIDSVVAKKTKPIYALPVLSSHLRADQTFQDGQLVTNDYTLYYQRIYAYGLEYLEAQRKISEAADDRAKADCQRAMTDCQRKAQRLFGRITDDIINTKFEGKNNYFKEGLMSNRLEDSATAIWTADPRLNLDEIAMNEEMAKALGVNEGDSVMTWRDPVLRDAGVRYMKVKLSNEIYGVAINPAMDKGYDGDFDGDTIAIKKLETLQANKEAEQKFSVKANLLDYGAKNEDGSYSLMMNHGLDLKVAEYNHPELKEEFDDITKSVNAFEKDFNEGKISYEEVDKLREEAVKRLNDYTHTAFNSSVGEAIISYEDMPSHIASCEEIVKSGAKGSYGKLDDYCNYLGARYEYVLDEEGEKDHINLDTVEDLDLPFDGDKEKARQASLAVEYATSVKTSVGVAGKTSQRGVKALRNDCQKAVLEMTYPVTQGLLQAKHDPVDARQKYATVMNATRDLWKGYKLNLVQVDMLDENGHKMYDDDGSVRKTEIFVRATEKNDSGYGSHPVLATKEEFIDQMIQIYSRKDMLNVPINEEYVHQVAEALVEKNEKSPNFGKMRNVEDPSVGSPMDRLAYKSNSDTAIDLLKDMAAKGESLFDGKYNMGFAPQKVMKNIQREFRNVNYTTNHDLEEFEVISKNDTVDKSKRSKTPLNAEYTALYKEAFAKKSSEVEASRKSRKGRRSIETPEEVVIDEPNNNKKNGDMGEG